MKVLIIVLVVLVLIVLAILGVVVVRWVRRTYQRYSGLERQRDSAKASRVSGADRLKSAERKLVEAQRALGVGAEAQAIERQRTRLSTLADRLRHATYGYSPIGSANPVGAGELADLQQRDADTIADAQGIADLAEDIRQNALTGQTPNLSPLTAALDLLQESLDRRRAVS